MAAVLTQMVSEATDIKPEDIIVEPPDTSRTPDSGTTTASRQTLFSGEAAVQAASKLKKELAGKTLSELNGREFFGEYKPETDPMGSDKANPVSHVAYGYAAQVVELEQNGKIKKVTAAYDLGTLVNPKTAEGQIEGGIVMGIGYGLTEDFPVVDGYPTAKYGTLGLIRATDAPEIETIIVSREHNKNAPAPAIQGAYYRLDGKFRRKLPMEGTYYDK
jgi:CO/xanthine dehydrogenase Mo-binding subunit